MLEGSILKKLVGNRTAEQTPLNFGVYYKNTLVALCHALEDCILAMDCAPLVVTAFQRGKWYLQEAERYGAIADKARSIAIMASPDSGFHTHSTSQRANVHLIDLKGDDPVSQEWHLIILAPNYTAMVLCQELSAQDYGPAGQPQQDLERKFYGLWTFDSALVRDALHLAIDHIQTYDADLAQQLHQSLTAVLQEQGVVDQVNTPSGLSQAATRVVEYLKTSQKTLLNKDTLDVAEALDQNLVSNELQAFLRMAQLVDISDPVNPLGANEVSSLLQMMGQLLDLPAWRLHRLSLAGLFHRVAPFHFDSGYTEEDAPSCPLVQGAQVLRTMPRLRAVATIITHQTESWDGAGQPAGLAGDHIPLESRMLGLVSTFQQRIADRRQEFPEENMDTVLTTVLASCQAEQGTRWDPKLVEILALMVKGLQQGLSLPSIPSKATLGAGLLNPGWDDSSLLVGTEPGD